MKKIISMCFALILGVSAMILMPEISKGESAEGYEHCSYDDMKNRWLGGCKPKTGFICETTGTECDGGIN